jgi:hypothetical protein
MKTRMIERRLRAADPARGVDLDGATDATDDLRDSITGTAAADVGFDTSEIVLPAETALPAAPGRGSRLRRRHALVAAAAAVVLVGTVAGAVTVVADRGADDGPDVATANSAVTTTVPSDRQPSSPTTTVPHPTGSTLPPITIPTPTTVPGPGTGPETPGGGAPGNPSLPRCIDFDRPYPGWELRGHLLQQVPGGFGGLYDGGTGALVVSHLPGQQAAVARAKEAFDGTVCAQSPAIDYRVVANTAARLEALMGRLQSGGDISLHQQGVEVNAYGVDDSINKLRVGLAEVTPAAEQAVLDVLGASSDEVHFEQADVGAPV